MVNRPVKLLIAAGVLLALIGFQRSLWFVIAAPLGWIAGWCWWSYAAPKWRTWAITRGTDPRALQYYAEKANLLWPKGHWGERTEFGSRALRETQQPAVPYRGDPEEAAARVDMAPGFPGPPSNTAFLLWVVYWTVLLPAGMSILNFFRDRPTPISESWFLGLLNAITFAAMTYSRQSWRDAVSPEHAFGLGLVGLLLMIAISLKGTAPWSVWIIVLGIVLLLAPLYLLVRSTVEWRRRRRALRE